MDELTFEQAANIAKVSSMSIRNYVKNGLLKAYKKRKGLRVVYFIKESELRAFMLKYFD